MRLAVVSGRVRIVRPGRFELIAVHLVVEVVLHL